MGIQIKAKLTGLSLDDTQNIIQGLNDTESEMFTNFKRECCRHLKIKEDRIELNILKVAMKEHDETNEEDICCKICAKKDYDIERMTSLSFGSPAEDTTDFKTPIPINSKQTEMLEVKVKQTGNEEDAELAKPSKTKQNEGEK